MMMSFLTQYSKINKFDAIEKFICYNNNIALLSKNTLCIYEKEFNKLTNTLFNSKSLYYIKDKFFSDENFYFVNNKLKIIENLNGYFFSGIYFNNFLLFNNANYVLYDIESKNIILKNNFFNDKSIFKILNKYFICHGGYFLSCHQLAKIIEIWQLNFNELLNSSDAHQFGDIIEYNNKLFLFLSDYTLSAVFCIAIDTGKVIKKIENFGGWITLVENKIYIANSQNVRILNADTFEVETIDFSEALQPLGLQMVWNKFVVRDNEFYFVHENTGGGGEAIVGVLDLVTKKLLWHTSIPIEESSYWVSEIQVHNNRLYVLTQGGTLHIFEKE